MKKILLVDDEAPIRSMLRTLLETDDRIFVEAGNGAEAQQFLKADQFNLVISDVIMPDCDGIELIMSIRGQLPSVPVVMMSGGGRVHATQYLNLAEKLGAARVFEKPFNVKELRAAVAELLGDAEPEMA
jgi:DNA-binding NtrC family response regulator